MTEGVFLVSGVPGSGKTTVSRRLAQRFRRGAHIEADEIQNLIVSGGLHPQESPRREAMRQLRLRTTNASLLADSFAGAGIVPVIDDTVVDRDRLGQYMSDVGTRPLRLIMLAPPLDVALARDRTRASKQVGHLWAHLDGVMRTALTGVGLWLDTSNLTAEETVDAILDGLDDAVVLR